MEAKQLRKKLERAKEKQDYQQAAQLANQLGDFYLKIDKFTEALQYYKEDLELRKIVSDHSGVGDSYRDISDVLVTLNRFHDCYHLLQEGLDYVKQHKDKVNEEQLNAMMGFAYWQEYLSSFKSSEYRREDLLAKARHYNKLCVEQASQLETDKLTDSSKCRVMRGRALCNISYIDTFLGDRAKSERYFREAEKTFKSLNRRDELEELHNLYDSTASYNLEFDLDKAMELSIKSLNFARKTRENARIVNSLITTSKIRILRKQYEAAEEKLITGLEDSVRKQEKEVTQLLKIVKVIISETNKLRGEDKDETSLPAEPYETVGDLLSQHMPCNTWEKAAFLKLAIFYYKLAIERVEKNDMKRDTKNINLGNLTNSIAQCYEDIGDYKSALPFFSKAFNYEEGRGIDQCSTLSHIALCRGELRQETSAVVAEYRRWEELARRCGSKKQIVVCLQEEARYHREAGRSDTEAKQRLEHYLTSQGLSEADIACLEDEEEEEEDGGGGNSRVEDLLSELSIETVANRKRQGGSNFHPDEGTGEYPLHKLVNEPGEEASIRKLIKDGHPLDVKDKTGWSPLGDAMAAGILENIIPLVEAGADLELKQHNVYQRTPLVVACHAARLEVAEYLLNKGAKVHIPDYKELTELAYLRIHNLTGGDSLETTDLLQRLIARVEAEYRKLGVEVDTRIAPQEEVENSQDFVGRSSVADPGFDRKSSSRTEWSDRSESSRNSSRERGRMLESQASTLDNSFRKRGSAFMTSTQNSSFTTSAQNHSRNNSPRHSDEELSSISQIQTPKTKGLGASLYQDVLSSLGSSAKRLPHTTSTQNSTSRRSNNIRDDDDDDDDWLEDDLEEGRRQRQRERQDGQNSLGRKRERSGGERGEQKKPRTGGLDSDSEGDFEDASSLLTNLKNIDTDSEEDSRFKTPVLGRGKLARKRQTTMSQFVESKVPCPSIPTVVGSSQLPANHILPAAAGDSFPPPSPVVLPAPVTLNAPGIHFKARVRVEGLLLLIPVPMSISGDSTNSSTENNPGGSVPTNGRSGDDSVSSKPPTIGWLAEAAGCQYAKSEGRKPVLELFTDGALLFPEYLIQDILIGAENQVLEGRAVRWVLPPVTERYRWACQKTEGVHHSEIAAALTLAQSSTVLSLEVPLLESKITDPLYLSLNSWTALSQLRLPFCRIGNLGAKDLSPSLKSLHGLTHLDLSGNDLTHGALTSLASLPPRLSTLNLSYNPLGDLSLGPLTLMISSAVGSLRCLELSTCYLSHRFLTQDPTLITQFKLEIAKGLKELDLSGNPLECEGLAAVLQLLPPSLTRLDLASTCHPGPFPHSLHSYSILGQPHLDLSSLNLRNTSLADQNIEDLCKAASHFGKLKILDLSENSFSAEGLIRILDTVLEHCPCLTSLDIRDCGLVTEDVSLIPVLDQLIRKPVKLEFLHVPDTSNLTAKLSVTWRESWGDCAGIVPHQDGTCSFSKTEKQGIY